MPVLVLLELNKVLISYVGSTDFLTVCKFKKNMGFFSALGS